MASERSNQLFKAPVIDALCVSMISAGCSPIARVIESNSVCDLAFTLPNKDHAIVRCVSHANPSDYRALRTMLDDGDFDRAVLVYCDAEQPHLSDGIESWPISEIEALARRLVEEPGS